MWEASRRVAGGTAHLLACVSAMAQQGLHQVYLACPACLMKDGLLGGIERVDVHL